MTVRVKLMGSLGGKGAGLRVYSTRAITLSVMRLFSEVYSLTPVHLFTQNKCLRSHIVILHIPAPIYASSRLRPKALKVMGTINALEIRTLSFSPSFCRANVQSCSPKRESNQYFNPEAGQSLSRMSFETCQRGRSAVHHVRLAIAAENKTVFATISTGIRSAITDYRVVVKHSIFLDFDDHHVSKLFCYLLTIYPAADSLLNLIRGAGYYYFAGCTDTLGIGSRLPGYYPKLQEARLLAILESAFLCHHRKGSPRCCPEHTTWRWSGISCSVAGRLSRFEMGIILCLQDPQGKSVRKQLEHELHYSRAAYSCW
ncbi:hypothetical protein BCR41DRAFT_375828 [Lobosporangium transversale]|uniref:Uncharacterized protein n=1 Tax=Lobosporangium transversale TaxID=64571 RepID=A0A1Y2G5P0_9FUNG|nr:hypothetical protein BCR41DRAFT_375828 [Lobosporangium transversale]ORY95968.1 hypothetical protein BCR41DRAFT_375828 [Lobosporangium transversale]|eukprot:XP_021875409.1 hypothetical protein BCR41DRAFT_375828 [Lobosporangium transversale]